MVKITVLNDGDQKVNIFLVPVDPEVPPTLTATIFPAMHKSFYVSAEQRILLEEVDNG